MFVSSDNGLTVFYPCGPFQGYILPRRGFQRVLQRAIRRFGILAIATQVMSLLLGAVFGYGSAALAASSLALIVCYSMLIRRLEKPLQPLPFSLSFRFCAKYCDEQRLLQGLVGALLMSAIAIVLLVLKPNVMLAVCAAWFLAFSLLAAILVCVRHRLVRRVPRKLVGARR